MMFDEKYKTTIKKLNQIAKDIESLKKQKELNNDVIYRIIVVDRENIVFINTTNTFAPEDIRDKRNEIVQRESIYDNHLEIKDPIKLLKVNYKVMIVQSIFRHSKIIPILEFFRQYY